MPTGPRAARLEVLDVSFNAFGTEGVSSLTSAFRKGQAGSKLRVLDIRTRDVYTTVGVAIKLNV
eukprot:35831-Eustigmatos_ZCMA.PRE.1